MELLEVWLNMATLRGITEIKNHAYLTLGGSKCPLLRAHFMSTSRTAEAGLYELSEFSLVGRQPRPLERTLDPCVPGHFSSTSCSWNQPLWAHSDGHIRNKPSARQESGLTG